MNTKKDKLKFNIIKIVSCETQLITKITLCIMDDNRKKYIKLCIEN